MSLLDSFSFQVAEEPTDERTVFQKLGALHLLTALALVAALAVGALLRRRRQPPPPIAPAKRTDGDGLTVFYASQKGHSKNFAERLVAEAHGRGVAAAAVDLAIADPDRLVEHPRAVFIVATYAGGSAVPGTEGFFAECTEMSRDFRVEKTLLAPLSYAVFGCGNSEYPKKDFNACARKLDRAMRLLGARRLLPRREGDDLDNALGEQFDAWRPDFWRAHDRAFGAAAAAAAAAAARGDDAYPAGQAGGRDAKGRSAAQQRRFERMREQGAADAAKAEAEAAAREVAAAERREAAAAADEAAAAAGGECCGGGGGDGECGEGADCCRNGGGDSGGGGGRGRGERGYNEPPLEPSGGGLIESDDDEASAHGSDGGYGSDGGEVVDVEDLGATLVTKRPAEAEVAEADRKPMVSDSLRASLSKQGYRVVGSHSGVKLCRWTKAMLRGRGGCYKHTFYGIVSYQCMEATPSLACANKCVFCWRHHDNPVGTSFRWQVDDPATLLDGFEENHLAMMKQLKGVPGVKPERYAEAMGRVRHCALSLVGEPIIYPRINEFLGLLHAKGISSFMVTNAQFPEQMETLTPVTQLYISVDAPDAPELKAVDRPLFSDFWERFLACVDLLKKKKQRTVFRMTLVNGWNTQQLSKYVELVRRGRPDFVEVKGVTYCGDSKASPLTIKHCPFHAEVRAYCKAMADELGDEYELASEHAHSNIVLIAHKSFKIDGQWHTWIDYDKFAALATAGKPFGSMDYLAPTPEWAVYREDATDGGFDPGEERFLRKGGGRAVTGGGC